MLLDTFLHRQYNKRHHPLSTEGAAVPTLGCTPISDSTTVIASCALSNNHWIDFILQAIPYNLVVS